MHWFLNLQQARRIIEEWRIDYNIERPHSSLGYLMPEEFLKQKNEKITAITPKESVSFVKLAMVQ